MNLKHQLKFKVLGWWILNENEKIYSRYNGEAMKKVRADFGDDAVILSSNVVKSKGFLGLFKKKSVEVVAGFDEPVSRK